MLDGAHEQCAIGESRTVADKTQTRWYAVDTDALNLVPNDVPSRCKNSGKISCHDLLEGSEFRRDR